MGNGHHKFAFEAVVLFEVLVTFGQFLILQVKQVVGLPLGGQRQGELPDFLLMNWLLHIKQFVFRRDAMSNLADVKIRIPRHYHDLDIGVQLSDLFGS